VLPVLALTLCVGAVGGAVIANLSQPAPAHAAPLDVTPGSPSIADVTAMAMPSVVNISSTKAVKNGPAAFDPFYGGRGLRDGTPHPASMGSGVIVSNSGYILTNNHVVAGSDEIKVTLADGRDYKAKVVGADPQSDVAVVQMLGNVDKLSPIKFGDSSALRLGDVVLAMGNPFGVGQTVTMGIGSAKGRGNMGIVDYEDFIQTDAAINPGNSGGALINMRGELVGINTAILSRTGGYQGIGFAIPSNMARPIMKALIADGKVSRGWLGVSIRSVDSDLAREKNLSVAQGVYVAEVVAKTPAARAGLLAGDVVVAIDGLRTIEMNQLRNTVAMAGAGKTVRLDVVRGSGSKHVDVVLGELPKN
jgi:Do/DeqQ family serine protease